MIGKKTVLASLVIVIVSVISYANKHHILLSLLPKAMTSIMATDRIADLGDGLHLAICGAGGPMPSNTRSGPCIAVIANEKIFIVDAGTDGVRNLGRMQLNTGAVDAVFPFVPIKIASTWRSTAAATISWTGLSSSSGV